MAPCGPNVPQFFPISDRTKGRRAAPNGNRVSDRGLPGTFAQPIHRFGSAAVRSAATVCAARSYKVPQVEPPKFSQLAGGALGRRDRQQAGYAAAAYIV